MVMTLDEHIKKVEDDATQAESDSDWGFGNYFIDQSEALEYAENCRQLAEWLKDYKRLLEQKSDPMHRGMPGRWIVKDYCTKMGEHYKGYECPACHKEYNLKTNFCPDCGNRNGE